MLFITDKATLAIYLLLCCFITINLLSCTHTRTHKMEEARNVSSFDLCEKKNFYHPSLLCVFCHISLFSFVEENPMYLADTNYFSIHGMVCMWWLCVCPWLFVWLCLLRSERKLSPWSHIFIFYSSSLLQKNAQVCVSVIVCLAVFIEIWKKTLSVKSYLHFLQLFFTTEKCSRQQQYQCSLVRVLFRVFFCHYWSRRFDAFESHVFQLHCWNQARGNYYHYSGCLLGCDSVGCCQCCYWTCSWFQQG